MTAAVEARIGPTETFHIVYGYLGNDSGGSAVNLGPVALTGFGVCFRAQFSDEEGVDPCRRITGVRARTTGTSGRTPGSRSAV